MDKLLFDLLQTQLAESKSQVEYWKAKEAKVKQKYEAAIELVNQKTEAPQSKVIFDVGGTLFSTTKETLLRVKDSYFTGLIESGHWKPQGDGSYFIDRSPICFARIVDFMRYGKLNTTGLSQVEKEMLLTDFDYFFPLTSKSFIPKDHWLAEYVTILQDWLGKPLDMTACLFKASVDGATPKAFHQRCDKQGPTLTVVQSTKGWIFGGYNPKSWHSEDKHTNTKDAFIFTLKNPNRIPPTRYFCKPSNYYQAVYNGVEHGPTFSNGWTALHASGSGIFFPDGYIDTTGLGIVTFTGNKTGVFYTKEVEVYAV